MNIALKLLGYVHRATAAIQEFRALPSRVSALEAERTRRLVRICSGCHSLESRCTCHYSELSN